MRLPWRRHRTSGDDQARREAAERLAELRERAERVVPLIERRQRQNHWTETVRDVVRGGT